MTSLSEIAFEALFGDQRENRSPRLLGESKQPARALLTERPDQIEDTLPPARDRLSAVSAGCAETDGPRLEYNGRQSPARTLKGRPQSRIAGADDNHVSFLIGRKPGRRQSLRPPGVVRAHLETDACRIAPARHQTFNRRWSRSQELITPSN